MALQTLATALFGGFVGGNLAGSLLRVASLGTLLDSLAGLLGGAIGHYVATVMGSRVLSMQAGFVVINHITHVAAGAAGGITAVLIVSLLSHTMRRIRGRA